MCFFKNEKQDTVIARFGEQGEIIIPVSSFYKLDIIHVTTGPNGRFVDG